MKFDVIQFRVGPETHPTQLLVKLGEAHGVRAEVLAALNEKRQPAKPYPGGLPQLLRTQRDRTGLSVNDVHERSGMSKTQINVYETDPLRNPSLKTLLKIAYGYRLPFLDVMLATITDIVPYTSYEKDRPDENS